MEIDRYPLLDVLNVELLTKGQVERVKHEARAKRIHEQSGHARTPGQKDALSLRSAPRFTVDHSPLQPDHPARRNHRKDDHPDEPGSVGVDPKAKQRGNQPQGGVARLAEALENDQQNDEKSVT